MHSFSTSLEQELAEVLRESGLQGRQARAVATRLGWSGRGATTLAHAAEQEGYTRERVRQLEGRLRRHAEDTPLSLPLTAAALRLVENAAPVAYSRVPKRARPRRAVGGTVRPVGRPLGSRARPARRPRLRARRRRHARRRDRAGRRCRLRREQAREAKRRRDGVGARRAPAGRRDPGTARQVLEAQTDVIWLDDHREWFLVRGARTPVANALRKMLSVARSLSLADVDAGLRRAFRPVRLPQEVLLRVCESTPWLTVDDNAHRHRQDRARRDQVPLIARKRRGGDLPRVRPGALVLDCTAARRARGPQPEQRRPLPAPLAGVPEDRAGPLCALRPAPMRGAGRSSPVSAPSRPATRRP